MSGFDIKRPYKGAAFEEAVYHARITMYAGTYTVRTGEAPTAKYRKMRLDETYARLAEVYQGKKDVIVVLNYGGKKHKVEVPLSDLKNRMRFAGSEFFDILDNHIFMEDLKPSSVAKEKVENFKHKQYEDDPAFGQFG